MLIAFFFTIPILSTSSESPGLKSSPVQSRTIKTNQNKAARKGEAK